MTEGTINTDVIQQPFWKGANSSVVIIAKGDDFETDCCNKIIVQITFMYLTCMISQNYWCSKVGNINVTFLLDSPKRVYISNIPRKSQGLITTHLFFFLKNRPAAHSCGIEQRLVNTNQVVHSVLSNRSNIRGSSLALVIPVWSLPVLPVVAWAFHMPNVSWGTLNCLLVWMPHDWLATNPGYPRLSPEVRVKSSSSSANLTWQKIEG